MFSIKPQKGKVVITKSSPGNGKLLANALLENLRLKSQLEQVPDAVQSPDVVRHVQPQTMDKQLEESRIDARVKTMKSLDVKAKASQEGYSDSRYVIRNCKVGLGALNCPNQAIYNQILEDNTKLMSHGHRPHLTYESWVQASENESLGSNPDVVWNKHSDPVLAVSTPPAFIVKHSYYILYEAGVCYYLSSGMSVPSILKRASSENTSAVEVDNSSMLISCAQGSTWRNLTRPEYDSIVSVQPSKNSLFKLYIQFVNEAGLQIGR